MKKFLPIILITFLVGLISAGGYFLIQSQSQKQTEQTQSETDRREARESRDNTDQQNNSSGNSRESEQIVSPKGLFKVDLPQSGDTISSSVRIKGWANVFEGQFQVRIKDANGTVLGNTSVMASEGAPNGGTFDTTITFTQPSQDQQGTVEIYDLSQKDGSIDDIVTIQVTIKGK